MESIGKKTVCRWQQIVAHQKDLASDYKPCLTAKQVSSAHVKADKELAYPES